MKSVSLSEFKRKSSELIKTVQKAKRPLVVTRRGEPIVRIEPIVQTKTPVRLGALKGRMIIAGDIIRSDIENDFLVR